MAKTEKKVVEHVVRFEFGNATKGALRYVETALDGVEVKSGAAADDMLVGSLYLRKAKVEGEPKALEVTVRVVA